MQTLIIGTTEIGYTLRRSTRTRSLRISIYGREDIVVTAPPSMSERSIERFVTSRAHWIADKLEYLRKLPAHLFLKNSKKDYEMYKASALVLATERIAHFNREYGFAFKKISIRNQKTRWGSCSKTGTISFNYKIALLPSHLADYIIVHELCHVGEMNHSRKFWALVARTMPEYATLRKELNGRGIK
jgi:predicted metal-dependent hydrolase